MSTLHENALKGLIHALRENKSGEELDEWCIAKDNDGNDVGVFAFACDLVDNGSGNGKPTSAAEPASPAPPAKKDSPQDRGYYTIPEAMEYLNISRPTLYRFLREGYLVGQKFGIAERSPWRISLSAMSDFVRDKIPGWKAKAR